MGSFKVLFQHMPAKPQEDYKSSEYETGYHTGELSERIILKFTLWQDINRSAEPHL